MLYTKLYVCTCYTVDLMVKQWKKPQEDMKPRVFSIADASTDFKEYYDKIQEFIKVVAGYDEMLPGKSPCIESIL